jgi:hypothetical protein
MLSNLQQLHADILAGLDELEALTAEPQPPMDRLPAVRLSLTRASKARMRFLERLYDQLITRAPSAQKAAILTLKAEGTDNLVASSRHIGTWTLREIDARWFDYCAASNTMRHRMRQRIQEEANLLYPMLSRTSTQVLAEAGRPAGRGDR